jgi:hypothetical protein
MNRSILIVICDFLLLSLLTFSTDVSKIAGLDEEATLTVKADLVSKSADNTGRDLAAVMKQALSEEQKNRESLQAELVQARATAQQQQANLQQQLAAAQASIQNLNRQLQSSSAQASKSKEQLTAAESQVQKQTALVAALQQQLAQLSSQFQAAQTDKRVAAGQLALMQQQVQVERAEKARLAEGVKALATNSSTLTREIRENRALAPNAIFSEFVSNRVQATFVACRTRLFGFNSSLSKETETVLVTDGTNIYALCHVQDTPLKLWAPGTDWNELTGTLNRNITQVPIRALSFHCQDPRIVFMPVTPAEVRQLGGKIYPISKDPYKFQDAVLVGTRENYYGQCDFQMDLNTPEYVKLDRNVLKGLFGKFNPTRGDLVFSRNGELLGIMANSTYCLVLHDFKPTATFKFGPDVRDQHTGDTLSRLYAVVFQMPLRLQ